MADADPIAFNDIERSKAKAKMSKKQRRNLIFLVLAAVVLVGAVGYWIWYDLVGSQSAYTDDAYVGADTASITSLISGQVADVKVADTAMVRKGDILVRIDGSDARIALAQAQADLAKAQRDFGKTRATSGALAAQENARRVEIEGAQAQLQAAQANVDKARIDLRRRQALAPEGAVSGDELTTAANSYADAESKLAVARTGVAQANASREAARGDLAANEALVSGSTLATNPDVMAAQARVDQAQLSVDRTIVRAPISGMIVRRSVQIGQSITPASVMMTIVPISQVYVDANFKEIQLRHVQPGQPVTLTSDLYGSGVVFHGRVTGLAGGTGSAFALIPAQNATGNWIKVVQRIPVRVTLDPNELSAHPLRVGLSMTAQIDLAGK